MVEAHIRWKTTMDMWPSVSIPNIWQERSLDEPIEVHGTGGQASLDLDRKAIDEDGFFTHKLDVYARTHKGTFVVGLLINNPMNGFHEYFTFVSPEDIRFV